MPWDDDLDRDSPAYGIAADPGRIISVVAGPGTGKSFALKRRVARLLETGISPTRILPVGSQQYGKWFFVKQTTSSRSLWPGDTGETAGIIGVIESVGSTEGKPT
jgi:hypothetical protein